ncbi:MAG: tRNA (adenosine(37)-N6)-threonylcarbamoyltransferase complex ATPase subunit type 1 TsaE [Tannerella sp.]|nr:tRNA (adenosine(37)-N6)-threonylcarbamoyltransferase complex ATPase subunit type 1 TsaE [Tannerella sp.]
MADEFQLVSKSEACTKNMARTIARFFHPGNLIVLDGDLGAGKTHFVKGFAEGLGSADAVTSPTFSIANFYRTCSFDLLHVDLYRIASVDEFNDLGLSDYFDTSVALIEWGMKFADCLSEYLLVSFELNGDERLITFASNGEKYDLMMDRIKTELC